MLLFLVGYMGCGKSSLGRKAARRLGVEFETDVIIGRTLTIDDLLDREGYDAVFVGSGAGLPRFMGIEGENLNGVFSANEFLTRVNLMGAYDSESSDTPVWWAAATSPWTPYARPSVWVPRRSSSTGAARPSCPHVARRCTMHARRASSSAC